MGRYLLADENAIEADANVLKYRIARRDGVEPFECELHLLRVTELLRYAAIEHGPETERALLELRDVIADYFSRRRACVPLPPGSNMRPRRWANREW